MSYMLSPSVPAGVDAIRSVLGRVEDLQHLLEDGTREQVQRETEMMSRIEALENENRTLRPLVSTVSSLEMKLTALSKNEVASHSFSPESCPAFMEEIDNVQSCVMEEVTSLLRSFKMHFTSVEVALTEKHSVLATAVEHLTRCLEGTDKNADFEKRLSAIEKTPIASELDTVSQRLSLHEQKITSLECSAQRTHNTNEGIWSGKMQSLERSVSQLSNTTTNKMASLEHMIRLKPLQTDGASVISEKEVQSISSRLEEMDVALQESMSGKSRLAAKIESIERAVCEADSREVLNVQRIQEVEAKVGESMNTRSRLNTKVEAIERSLHTAKVADTQLLSLRLDEVDTAAHEALGTGTKVNSKLEAFERTTQHVMARIEEVESSLQNIIEQESKLTYKIEVLEKAPQTRTSAPELQRLTMRIDAVEASVEAAQESVKVAQESAVSKKAVVPDLERARLSSKVEVIEQTVQELCRAQESEAGSVQTELREMAGTIKKMGERAKGAERVVDDLKHEGRTLEKRVAEIESTPRPEWVSLAEHGRLASKIAGLEQVHESHNKLDLERLLLKVEAIERSVHETERNAQSEKRRLNNNNDSKYEFLCSRVSEIEKVAKDEATSSRLQSLTLPFSQLNSRVEQLEVTMTEARSMTEQQYQHQVDRLSSRVEMMEKHTRGREQEAYAGKSKEHDRMKTGIADMSEKLQKLVLMEKVVNDTLSDTTDLKARLLAMERVGMNSHSRVTVDDTASGDKLRRLDDVLKGVKIDMSAQGNALREMVHEAVSTANIANKKASSVKHINESDVQAIQNVLDTMKEDKRAVDQRMESLSRNLHSVAEKVEKSQTNIKTLKSQVKVLQNAEREEVTNLSSYITKIARQVEKVDEQLMSQGRLIEGLHSLENLTRKQHPHLHSLRDDPVTHSDLADVISEVNRQRSSIINVHTQLESALPQSKGTF
eukprot:TRINITY_DN12104_c0_g1_i2.p1 TRINITY_DN12104_c0_g1~~TRINITY_DN12104_c0_g1_i2.p1  ORF type:complete len:946 (+),score=250.67 TRINITY_DN12104_c0_g1_i2:34-2871(+)